MAQVSLEFIAKDEPGHFVGVGTTFLQAAIDLLKKLTVYVEVDERVYEALGEAYEEEGPCEIDKTHFTDPEAGFILKRN